MSKLSVYAVALASIATAFHLSAATPEALMNAALVPEADAYFYSNDAKVYASAITKPIEEFGTKLAKLIQDADSATPKVNLQALEDTLKRLGLANENIEASALSAMYVKLVEKGVKQFQEDLDEKFSTDEMSALFAVAFKKPVTKENLNQIIPEIKKLLPADADLDEVLEHLAISGFKHGDATGYTFAVKVDEEDFEDMPFVKPPVFVLAICAEGKVILLGFERDVKTALDRANAGTKAEPSAALKKLLDSTLANKPFAQYDCYGAFVVPQAFRDQMVKLEKQMADNSYLPPGVMPGIKAATVLQGMRFAQTCADKLDFAINFVLDTPDSATTLKDVLQINVLNMAKMGLFQLTGKNLAFAESLNATADANSTSMNFAITVADLNFAHEFIEKKIKEPRAAPLFIDEDWDDDEEWDDE